MAISDQELDRQLKIYVNATNQKTKDAVIQKIKSEEPEDDYEKPAPKPVPKTSSSSGGDSFSTGFADQMKQEALRKITAAAASLANNKPASKSSGYVPSTGSTIGANDRLSGLIDQYGVGGGITPFGPAYNFGRTPPPPPKSPTITPSYGTGVKTSLSADEINKALSKMPKPTKYVSLVGLGFDLNDQIRIKTQGFTDKEKQDLLRKGFTKEQIDQLVHHTLKLTEDTLPSPKISMPDLGKGFDPNQEYDVNASFLTPGGGQEKFTLPPRPGGGGQERMGDILKPTTSLSEDEILYRYNTGVENPGTGGYLNLPPGYGLDANGNVVKSSTESVVDSGFGGGNMEAQSKLEDYLKRLAAGGRLAPNATPETLATYGGEKTSPDKLKETYDIYNNPMVKLAFGDLRGMDNEWAGLLQTASFSPDPKVRGATDKLFEMLKSGEIDYYKAREALEALGNNEVPPVLGDAKPSFSDDGSGGSGWDGYSGGGGGGGGGWSGGGGGGGGGSGGGGGGSGGGSGDLDWIDYPGPVTDYPMPDWWKPTVPKDVNNPEGMYFGVANTLLPFLSPEDQRKVAAMLFNEDPETFGAYDPDILQIPGADDITTEMKQLYYGATRAEGVISALDSIVSNIDVEDADEDAKKGHDFLKNLAALMRQFFKNNDNISRQDYMEFMNAVDPLLQAAQSDDVLSPYYTLGRMLVKPFFTAGELYPYQRVGNDIVFGEPNDELLY